MDFAPTDLRFEFPAPLWLSSGDAGWVFASVPVEVADAIEELAPHRGGFGSVPVEVTVGTTTWRTSLFADTKRATYLLPVKRAVRTAERLEVGDTAVVGLVVLRPV